MAVCLVIDVPGGQLEQYDAVRLFIDRAVQTRPPPSSVTTISYVTMVRPRCTGVATPVTMPERTALW